MKITINKITPAKYLVERLEERNSIHDLNKAIEYLNKDNSEIYLFQRGEIEWETFEDLYSNQTKTGLKYLDLNFSNGEKYFKLKVHITWNTRDKAVGLYITSLSVFSKKIRNGVLVDINKEMIGFAEFEEQLNELVEEPNFLQVFNNTADIEAAIEIYADLVSTREKEGSISIPISDFEIKQVVDIDFKKVVTNTFEYWKAKTSTFIDQKTSKQLPSDAIGQKYLMLKIRKPISLPKNLQRTLFSIIKNGGQLTVSDEMRISLGTESIKLKDFLIKKIDKKISSLSLFIEGEIDDEKIINIFDKLERIRSNTMLSVIEDIKQDRINNNNLFQFLFNNGDISNISTLEKWPEINEEKGQELTKELDDLQKEAFNLAIDSFPITFIQGPPGTGKTHIISKICKYYENAGLNVLVSSQTNVAVENILEKLNEDATYNGIGIKADFGKSPYSLQHIPTILSKKIANILEVDDFELSNFGVNDILMSSNIVGSTTTSSSLNRRMWNDFYKNNDVLIVDEISKSSVPELIRYVVNSKKIIFVGDQRQLEPLEDFDKYDEIWEKYSDEEKDVVKNYISVSIFDKLFKTMESNKRTIMLKKNRRSIQALADVYSTFYDDKLIAERKNEDSLIKWKTKPWYPFTFISMNGSQEIKNKNGSRMNVREAEFVDKLLTELAEKIENSQDLTVAIIALYGAQVAKIRELTEINFHKNNNFKNIKVNTVDAFQGDQADIVILSTIRADKTMSTGFADNYRRINVSLSRAKDLAIVLGNDTILKNIAMKYDGKNRLFFNEIFLKVQNARDEAFEKPLIRKNVG